MDDILIYEKYKNFPDLLDFVYKSETETWVSEFSHTKYNAFKRSWPQVHVIDDFADPKSKKLYYKELKRNEPVSEFSLSAEMQLPSDLPELSGTQLTPLPHRSKSSTHRQKLQDKAFAFYTFLRANWNSLSDLKLQPFEVHYLPNKYGLPESVQIREGKLRSKVNYLKELLTTYKPINIASMQILIDFVTSDTSGLTINPNFSRYMLRKHAKEKPEETFLLRRCVRHKQLIPDERNIKFHYRQYLVSQFAFQDGQYIMSPMKNMYD